MKSELPTPAVPIMHPSSGRLMEWQRGARRCQAGITRVLHLTSRHSCENVQDAVVTATTLVSYKNFTYVTLIHLEHGVGAGTAFYTKLSRFRVYQFYHVV